MLIIEANRLQLDLLLEDAHKAVVEALHQINSRAYDACFSSYPYITDVVKIGIAFAKRLVSAGNITTTIEKIIQKGSVLTNEDITFYDAHHGDDTEKKT